MQSVNRAQFLNITFLFLLLGAAVYVVFGTVIVPLTSMYAWLKSRKLDLNIAVLNLIWLAVLYTPCDSSFISTQFLVLNLDGLFSNKFIIFWYSIIILLY